MLCPWLFSWFVQHQCLMGSAQVPFGGNLGEVAHAALLSGQLVLVMVCGYLTVLDSKNQAAVKQRAVGVKVDCPLVLS